MKKNLLSRVSASILTVALFFSVTFGSESLAENGHKLSLNARSLGAASSVDVSLSDAKSTDIAPSGSFSAATPNVITFLSQKNKINVAYCHGTNLVIQRYGNSLSLEKTITIPSTNAYLGDICADDAGYYYAMWGNPDTNAENIVTIVVSKYDSNGNLKGQIELNGYDTSVNIANSGTRSPFSGGSCDMTIINGTLVINYGREMYNGHQSNMVLYIRTSDMKRLGGDTAYCSHSFDQRAYTLTENRVALLNHGDAYPRAFMITVENMDDSGNFTGRAWSSQFFHFREGPNRGHGYNETLAQMGGLAQVSAGLIFVGSSERELSLTPKNTGYLGHDVARDLFMQVFLMDGKTLTGMLQGETRNVTGSVPSAAETELFLHGNESDEGVIWLTAYDEAHYAANPKIVSLGGNRALIMWEKRPYVSSVSPVETYYAVVDGAGNVVMDTTRIVGYKLAANTDPLVYNGKVYWATKDEYGARLNYFDPYAVSAIVYPTSITLNKKSADLSVGGSLNLKATMNPADSTKSVLGWKSSNTAVAEVDQNGNVTAKMSGTATITASVGNVSASCVINVYNPVNGIYMNTYTEKMRVGGTYTFRASYYPTDAGGDTTLVWKSSNTKVATVDSNGKVTAVGTGDTVISVTVQGKTDEVKLNVYEQKIEYIAIISDIYAISVGQEYTLEAQYWPDDADGDTTIAWKSSDNSIAKVDSKGKITGLKEGPVIIYATAQGKSAQLKIEVKSDSPDIIEDLNTSEGEKSKNNTETESTKNLYAEYGLDDRFVPDGYIDNSGSPMIMTGFDCRWVRVGVKAYWYEGDIKQGTYYDTNGVIGDGKLRGREIYDPESDGWYWLDSVYDGAKAEGKEVWVPYIYQNESEWDETRMREVAYESDEGMGECVYYAMRMRSGKWVRYDENGRMLKGWVTITGALAEKYPDQQGNTYYYDTRTGLMAKGYVTLNGNSYHFNEETGVLDK